MYRWCTDEVEPHDRFDYWREVRAKGLFGVTAELERERRADFLGEFSLRQLGGASLVELKASAYTVERSASDIASAPGDAICVYQQLGSGGWFGGMRGSDFASQTAALPPAIPTCLIVPRRSAQAASICGS